MTREEARHWLEVELKTWEDECKSKHPIKEALGIAIKALEQEPVLDKIRAEIESSRQYYEVSMDYGDAYREQELSWVLELIDKYSGKDYNNKKEERNMQLGDVYWTENGYGGISDYVFVARQGQFIIGVEEEYGCRNRIVDQLHHMCEETLEEDGVDMYVHYANKCYPTYEDAEEVILGSED